MNKPGYEYQLIQAVVAALRAAIGSAAEVTVADANAGTGGAEIRRNGNRPIHLRFRAWDTVTEQAGEPGDVWVLNRASSSVLQRLRARGENFVALNGAVRVVQDWLVLDRTDLVPQRSMAAATVRTAPFADRNSLIARTLLAHPGREWSVRGLATAAGVALGTASQVLQALSRANVIQYQREGRAARVWVNDPACLLRRWFAAYTWERNEMVAFHAPIGDPARFIHRFPDLGTRWALTLHAGASLVAPLATWEPVHAYMDVASRDELVSAGLAQGWTPAEDGSVVLMKPFYKSSIWEGVAHVGGIPVASALQLALDLWHYPLRGREQAEHLLETVLKVGAP